MKRSSMMRMLAMALVTTSVAMTGCSEDENLAAESRSGEDVKGSIIGTIQSDKTALNGDFNYANYSPAAANEGSDAYYIENENGDIDVNIFRRDSEDEKAAMLYFVLKENDLQNPTTPYMQISYSEGFSMDSNTKSNTLTVTDFSFDRTTGRIKGKLQLSGSGNSAEAKATVTSEFDVTVKKIVS